MSDEEVEKFWENKQPEDFAGWQEEKLNFKGPPKKSATTSRAGGKEGLRRGQALLVVADL
jgi:hypothetical protein